MHQICVLGDLGDLGEPGVCIFLGGKEMRHKKRLVLPVIGVVSSRIPMPQAYPFTIQLPISG
jgi:hypothetical protein